MLSTLLPGGAAAPRMLAALALLLTSTGPAPASAQDAAPLRGRTYVIVHGAWGGGWSFRQIDSLLTAQGARVYRPTLTGLGERVHLAGPEVNLSTHIQDVVNVLRYEDLRDVVLVGHSYGGMVISGVADRVPDRIRHLVYLDAFLPESGESVNTLRGQGGPSPIMQWERDGLIVPPWYDAARVPGDVPHPVGTFTEPLVLDNPAARSLPATYVLTVDPGAQDDAFSPYAERARGRGWSVLRMEADHNPQWSAPDQLARLLASVR